MRLLLPLFIIVLFSCGKKEKTIDRVIVKDIANFWLAYDQIQTTDDTLQQRQFINELFINKASNGQKAMFAARNYSDKEYLDAIHNFPKFWNSIRRHTEHSASYTGVMTEGIDALNALYPELKPAKIYLTIGALRSNGTTLDSLVLIGSELAFADSSTVSSEFPERLSHLESYFNTNPRENLLFLNIHEYVHTQ